MLNICNKRFFVGFGVALSLIALPVHAQAQSGAPAFEVSNEPLPQDLQGQFGANYTKEIQTSVGRKVEMLRQELFGLESEVASLSQELDAVEDSGQSLAANYFASVATINTQLQIGTTPGNPRLVSRLNDARQNLDRLGKNVDTLNRLSDRITQAASNAAFLLDAVQSTYNLYGAVEEDHERLEKVEDGAAKVILDAERLSNAVNEDILRAAAYLETERENLQIISLAVSTGELFGKSLSNRPFSGAPMANLSSGSAGGSSATMAAVPQPSSGTSIQGGPRPLVKIKFDKANVAYEQPVYMAVNEAMDRYPGAQFELVAVHPSQGNAAMKAIESTKARRNAEKVLRSLTKMGLPTEKIRLSHMPSTDVNSGEVHIYIR